MRHRNWSRLAAFVVFAATVGQLLVATLLPDLDQFEGKAFGWRLLAYPLMMLAVPALWLLAQRRSGGREPAPWGAFTLVMAPFLIDVTGNSLDLYDSLAWWDDANHFVNWMLLCSGIGLIACRRVEPAWAVLVVVTGIGAVLAIGWELGEWFAFIRHGTEIDTAYEDTLGDEALGTLGAFVAALGVVRWRPRAVSGRAP
ncbi:hypothetical protein [Nocardioides sp. MH1]|uniref:hypothetical protein n=1 Tax=Nocardioides sp. MH1 TaxID=3242490 RepID=UPI00351FFD33